MLRRPDQPDLQNSRPNRRKFLKLFGGAASLALPGCSTIPEEARRVAALAESQFAKLKEAGGQQLEKAGTKIGSIYGHVVSVVARTIGSGINTAYSGLADESRNLELPNDVWYLHVEFMPEDANLFRAVLRTARESPEAFRMPPKFWKGRDTATLLKQIFPPDIETHFERYRGQYATLIFRTATTDEINKLTGQSFLRATAIPTGTASAQLIMFAAGQGIELADRAKTESLRDQLASKLGWRPQDSSVSRAIKNQVIAVGDGWRDLTGNLNSSETKSYVLVIEGADFGRVQRLPNGTVERKSAVTFGQDVSDALRDR